MIIDIVRVLLSLVFVMVIGLISCDWDDVDVSILLIVLDAGILYYLVS